MPPDMDDLARRVAGLEREVAYLKAWRAPDSAGGPGGTARPERSAREPARSDAVERAGGTIPPPVEGQSPPTPAGAGASPPARFGPAPTKDLRALETQLVGTWFPRLGALAVLLGAAFGFRYAVEAGLLGPGMRIAAGIAAGVSLLGWSEWSYRKQRPGLADATGAGGIGLLYLTVWAGFHLYSFIGPEAALIGLVGVSGASAWLALRHDSKPYAVVATLGAFLNPIAVGTSHFAEEELIAYVLMVDAGVIAIALHRRWALLNRIAVAATWALVAPSALSGGLPHLAVLTVFAALFASLPFLGTLVDSRPSTDVDIVPFVGNALLYFSSALILAPEEWRGPVALAISCAYGGLGALAIRRDVHDPWLTGACFGLGGMFALAWAYIQFEYLWVPFVWAALATGAVAIGRRKSISVARDAGVAVLCLSVLGTLFYLEPPSAERLLLWTERPALIGQLLLCYATAFLSMRPGIARDHIGAIVAAGLASIVTLAWITWEARSYLLEAGSDGQSLEFAQSVIWGVYAAALLTIGVARKLPAARAFGIGLFGVTIAKLVAVDLWLLDESYRTIAFAGLGIVLLGSSVLYHRVILERKNQLKS